MPKKSYVTSMPDKTGAFLLASKIISKYKGNIVRVSYNKAVDLHTLFIDVVADIDNLRQIEDELESVGYLNNKISETNVIVVGIKIPDVSGAVLPVLKILDQYDVNISYINSSENETDYQFFKMGLLIENHKIIKMLLDDISQLYQIDIIDYDNSDKKLDNTIFYIRLANEMQRLLDLDTEKTIEFISESNRILQTHEERGENPDKVFKYIRKFARFISEYKGKNFKVDIETVKVTDTITLYNIQPPCGSNTYVFDSQNDLVLIDTGYAVYSEEMIKILKDLFPNWDNRKKRVFITHTDVDHCGLLSKLDGVDIYLNEKSADGLTRQYEGVPDYREINDLGLGYSKLSRIISGYEPPNSNRFSILDNSTPLEHDDLIRISDFTIDNLEFEVYEGSGGHVYGEMIFVNRDFGIVFTGDNLVNINGFSQERAEFNSLAPYLMTSVNIDSDKAREMRKQIINLIEEIEKDNQKSCLICGGHGPISKLKYGKLVNLND